MINTNEKIPIVYMVKYVIKLNMLFKIIIWEKDI